MYFFSLKQHHIFTDYRLHILWNYAYSSHQVYNPGDAYKTCQSDSVNIDEAAISSEDTKSQADPIVAADTVAGAELY